MSHKQLLSLLLAIALGGCAPAAGVRLVSPGNEVTQIPEIDATFPAIPLRVGVYITLATAKSVTYWDGKDQGPLGANARVSYGEIGPAVFESIREYFPRVFDEVFFINDFPDRAVLLAGLDAVVVFESGVGSERWLGGGTFAPSIIDSLLNVGIYSPDGNRVAGYGVVATARYEPTSFSASAQVAETAELALRNMRSAVRLALHRFPREEVLAAVRAYRETASSLDLGDPSRIVERRLAMHKRISDSAPKVPVGLIDYREHGANQDNKLAMNNMMALMAGAQIMGGALSPATTAAMLASINTSANAPASDSGALIMEFLGGLSAAAQRRAAAMNAARTPPSAGRPSGNVCAELIRLANECRRNQASMGGGTTGQAGAFADCARMYQSAYSARCG